MKKLTQESLHTATSLRAAATLRQRILSGEYPPGTPLRELALIADLRIARNTLREAFQQLLLEGLTEYKLYKGTVVRRISADEVADIYLVRRTLELQAIAKSGDASETGHAELRRAIDRMLDAAARQEWSEVGTASLRFHQAIVNLLGSRKLNAFFEVIAAQLRLAFSTFQSEATFQAPWVARDQSICELICGGRIEEARTELTNYLAESERLLLGVLRATTPAARESQDAAKRNGGNGNRRPEARFGT